jgi:hypothetical protein
MTFGDLWKTLDWSASEMEEEGWLKENKGDKTDQDFKTKFRMTLVETALYGSGEQRQEAKHMLHMAGVWPQIVAFLSAHNLLLEVDDDRGDRDRSETAAEEGPTAEGGGSGGGDSRRDTPTGLSDQAPTDRDDPGEGI